MKVVIVDYKMGNIKSVFSALKFLGIDNIQVSNNRNEILKADKLILPGVGSFSKAMDIIKSLKLDESIAEAVIQNHKPILGICLGMQLMCERSGEDGDTEGLGFVEGQVTKLSGNKLKVPHVGFNQVKVNDETRLYKNILNMSDFYFTHSYTMTSTANIGQSYCDYGSDFIASYEVLNIAGVQFHPELSQRNGLKMIENFIKEF